MYENIFNYQTIGDEIRIGNDTDICGNGLINPNKFNGELNIPDKIGDKTVTVIGKCAFCGIKTITGLSLPSTIREIQYKAFDLCFINIETLNLSNVVTLGEYSFSSNNITHIVIGQTLSKISEHPFPCNNYLETIKVDLSNEYYSNDFQYCLYNKKQTILIQVPMKKDHIIIPNTVREIYNRAFEQSSLKELIIPEKCDKIHTEALKMCFYLTTIYIYSALSYSSEHCFSFLDSLSEVYYLNNAVVTKDIFRNCHPNMKIYTCNSYPLQQFANKDITKKDWTCQNNLYITCQNTSHQFNSISCFIIICLIMKK